jgi:phosphoserine phosphatase
LKADRELLRKAGLKPAGGPMWSRIESDELLSRIAASDILISDFDECMFPTITQAEASRLVLRRILESPFEAGHPELAANMLFHAAILLAQQSYQQITGDIQNSRLIVRFEKFAHGVPMEYFDDASDKLRGTCYAGAPDAFRVFATRGTPVGVISLGLDMVIRRLLAHVETDDGVKFDFFNCTHVRADSQNRFAGYLPGKTYTDNESKRMHIRARCAEYGAKRPLVIGHDRDDTMMFDETRNLGGTAIGFNPVPENYGLLDAAFFAEDWRPIAELFGKAFGE